MAADLHGLGEMYAGQLESHDAMTSFVECRDILRKLSPMLRKEVNRTPRIVAAGLQCLEAQVVRQSR